MAHEIDEHFLNTFAQHPVLPQSEINRLIRRTRVGIPYAADKARTRIVLHNQRLVISLALQYQDQGAHSVEDLIQEGNVALLRAIEKFDPLRGSTFTTYATLLIRQALQRFVQHERKRSLHPVISLTSLEEIEEVPDERGQDPQEAAEENAGLDAVLSLMQKLDPRSREILWRAGLDESVSGRDAAKHLLDLIFDEEGELGDNVRAHLQSLGFRGCYVVRTDAVASEAKKTIGFFSVGEDTRAKWIKEKFRGCVEEFSPRPSRDENIYSLCRFPPGSPIESYRYRDSELRAIK